MFAYACASLGPSSFARLKAASASCDVHRGAQSEHKRRRSRMALRKGHEARSAGEALSQMQRPRQVEQRMREEGRSETPSAFTRLKPFPRTRWSARGDGRCKRCAAAAEPYSRRRALAATGAATPATERRGGPSPRYAAVPLSLRSAPFFFFPPARRTLPLPGHKNGRHCLGRPL